MVNILILKKHFKPQYEANSKGKAILQIQEQWLREESTPSAIPKAELSNDALR